MTQLEFDAWQDYYVHAPFDDLHRFHRPAALVSTSIGGRKIKDMLEWLQPSKPDGDFSDADLSIFAAFGAKPPKR